MAEAGGDGKYREGRASFEATRGGIRWGEGGEASEKQVREKRNGEGMWG